MFALSLLLALTPQMVSIPAGSYVPFYGAPGARVAVHAFKIDREPVTEAQLRGGDAHTVATRVTLREARAYCTARGKRLPTIDEWEYVAAASRNAKNGRKDPRFKQLLIELYTRAKGQPRIGNGFVNAFGVADMHGVVWEWTDAPPVPSHEHHHERGKHDMGCASSAEGASDTEDFAGFLRYAFRNGLTPEMSLSTLGFRCAM